MNACTLDEEVDEFLSKEAGFTPEEVVPYIALGIKDGKTIRICINNCICASLAWDMIYDCDGL